jgi:hypothetical protein
VKKKIFLTVSCGSLIGLCGTADPTDWAFYPVQCKDRMMTALKAGKIHVDDASRKNTSCMLYGRAYLLLAVH